MREKNEKNERLNVWEGQRLSKVYMSIVAVIQHFDTGQRERPLSLCSFSRQVTCPAQCSLGLCCLNENHSLFVAKSKVGRCESRLLRHYAPCGDPPREQSPHSSRRRHAIADFAHRNKAFVSICSSPSVVPAKVGS